MSENKQEIGLEQKKESFEVGDMVRWNEANILSGTIQKAIEKYGNGSFEVVAVDGDSIKRLHTDSPRKDSLDEAINKAHPQILTLKVTDIESGEESTEEFNGDWIEKIN